MEMMMYSTKSEEWSNFKEELENLKSAVDPRYLIESLGFKIERETPKELRCACAIHGGDNKTAFRFNLERKTWVCFTHKCHDIFGNDIIGLVKASLNVEFMDAVLYLKKFVGDIGLRSVELKAQREREQFINSHKKEKKIHREVTEECLKYYKPFRSKLFLDEGFSKKTLDFFEVAGGWTDIDKVQRDIIPIRDENNLLVAYALRDIRKDVDDDRKYIFTGGFNKDAVLYNLNNAKKYGLEKPLIIVEGQKSVWRFHELGIYNAVAVMGSSITTGQVNLLYKYAYKGIVTMFDNDVAGIEGTLKAAKDMGEMTDVRHVFITEVDENGDGLDPSDLSADAIFSYLELYI
jgi:DNA primase